MKRTLLLLPLLALAAGISCGCCLLPIPVYYTHGPGVEGTVLEAGTDRPIPGATVVVRSGAGSDNCPDRTATTKPDGTFRIPTDWDIHFGVWAATPSSGTCLPFALFQDGDGLSRWFFNITIEADGFESFFGDNHPPFSPSENPTKIPSDGVYRLRPLNPAFAPATPSPAEESHAESAETAEPEPHAEPDASAPHAEGAEVSGWAVVFEDCDEIVMSNRYVGMLRDEVIRRLGKPDKIEVHPASNLVHWVKFPAGIPSPTGDVVVLTFDNGSAQIGGETFVFLQSGSNSVEEVIGDVEIPPGVVL